MATGRVACGGRRGGFARAVGLGPALAALFLAGCEPNVPVSDVKGVEARPPAAGPRAAVAPVASQTRPAEPVSPAPASPATASASTAVVDSQQGVAPVPSSLVSDIPGAGFTSQGYVGNVPAPDPADGAPFPIPAPLPECCRPVACDVAPPPRATDGGPVLRCFLRKGMEPGELAYARAIAGARDGSAYYVVDKLGRLQKLDQDLHVRVLARVPEIARGKPTGLYVADSGDVWVSDTHYSRVLVYSPELVLKRAWGAPGDKPGAFLFIRDVKELGDGRLLTVDYGDYEARVQVWKGEGSLERSFGKFGLEPGQFRRPMKVAMDLPRGELYVADSANHRIQVVGLDGSPKRAFGSLGTGLGQLKYPNDVLLDEDGLVWVADMDNHRVQVFDREGKALAVWGQPGRREGEIAVPWGIALEPGKRLLVLDSGNDRVYELDRAAILRAGRGEGG